MSAANNLSEPKFGYWFTNPDSSHTSGSYRLEIYINETPTKQHFDPEKLHLFVKSETGLIESLAIRHPWDFNSVYQALAGSIEMTDRNGKEEEAYTFGGSFKIESQDLFTICTLDSPAPILEISSANHLLMTFIEEVEILFAKRRAALLSKPHIYEQHLVNADPFKLYYASLNALIEQFEHVHHQENQPFNEFLNFLHVEGKRIKDAGSALFFAPALEDIL
jgi:hypothetical protein